jgi:hypothetical protein
MEENNKIYRVFEHFKCLCLALFPILSLYVGFSVFDLGTLVLLALILLEILIKRGAFEINFGLLLVLAR